MISKGITPSFNELVELCEPSAPQISPYGQQIVYSKRSVDWENNRYIDQLWMIDMTGEKSQFKPLLPDQGFIWSYRWAPDGAWLAFGHHRPESEYPALELLNPSTGKLFHVTDLTSGGYGFQWIDNGNRIVYLASGISQGQHSDADLYPANAKVVGKEWSKDQLWVVSLDDNKPVQITAEDFYISSFDCSPDSQTIVFAAVPTPDENDWDQSRIYQLNIKTGEIQLLTDVGCQKPQFSPDGRQIMYKKLGKPSFIDVSRIGIMDINGENQHYLSPFDNETYLLQWKPEGIYLLAIEGVTTHLYRMNPQTGKAEQLTPDEPAGFAIPEGWIGWGCSFTRDGQQIAYIGYDLEHFAEIMILNTETRRQTILSDHTEQIESWNLPAPELFRWKSKDGLQIEGILIKPVDFQPDFDYPLVVVAHGGPTHTSMLPPMIDGDWWYGALPQLLHKGAMVLFVNYRGSNGYGADFQKANVLELGVVELADIISGVDALAANGWVDAQRVGIVGMSHGGYLAAFAATASHRFKAAVMLSGISDWALNYYMTDTRVWMQQYLQAAPWENPDIYQRTSPVSYLSTAQTPLLIQHGERDQRAPIANAHAIYRGLRDNGIPVRLVVYPEQGHGIGNPVEFRRCIQETYLWFEQWLWEREGDLNEK